MLEQFTKLKPFTCKVPTFIELTKLKQKIKLQPNFWIKAEFPLNFKFKVVPNVKHKTSNLPLTLSLNSKKLR